MLFENVNVGNIALKNRIVMPAINLGYCTDGKVNDRLINFYTERAKGGAGLIMIGGTAIEAQEVWGGFVSIHDDSFIEGHQKLTTTLKKHGALVGIQLFHAGRYSYAFAYGHDIKAPSAIMSPVSKQIPQEITIDEIQETIHLFGQAALRAKKAGYDVIEVIASAGYLINQFYSPVTNKRTDEYGGSLENRMRFGLEVIKEIRHQVGNDMTLSIRLGGSDFVPEGNTWREMTKFASELEKASLDMINVTGGWHESRIPQIQAEVPRGAYTYLATKIKDAVSIPVVASNRINNPETAEAILLSGKADMVSVGRGFIADPEWAVKAEAGRANTIRSCIGCMICLDKLFDHTAINQGVTCTVNPSCGLEAENSITKTSNPLQILVIGAGPAGLETARVAATKGHRVTLLEKESKIGGQWNIASVPPGKSEFHSLLIYYENILPELGVKILFNTLAETKLIQEINPDKIVVATGATPSTAPFAIDKEVNIVEAWEVLAGKPIAGSEIVVIGGGSVGCETALHIAELGTIDADTLKFLMLHQAESPETLYNLLTKGSYNVTLIEMEKYLARDMGRSTRWTVMKHMQTMGIKIMNETIVKEVNTDGVKVLRNGEEILLKTDTVVTALGSTPNTSLYQELKQMFSDVHLVGDAVTPAKALDAIHQAFLLAKQL
ncbi:MAG TPA: NAD(P)/FAD-dependent oxidoreductase [Syntrophomonadaceae bacterium]|nr:NAD(P)/FAD-dependent oxidoreductase [Syntrophomonadaceae bacterium]